MLSSVIAKEVGAKWTPPDYNQDPIYWLGRPELWRISRPRDQPAFGSDANDYVGKRPIGWQDHSRHSKGRAFVASQNIIVGNVRFMEATSGEAYFNGMAGERFAVRNSVPWRC